MESDTRDIICIALFVTVLSIGLVILFNHMEEARAEFKQELADSSCDELFDKIETGDKHSKNERVITEWIIKECWKIE